MDPATIYGILVAAIFLIICYAIFSVATRESGFDENYSKSKLVSEDDKNVKGKAKNTVKVKKPAKTERKTTVEKQEVSVNNVESVKSEPTTSDAPPSKESPKIETVTPSEQVNDASSKNAAKKNKKKVKKVDSLDSNSETTSTDNVPTTTVVEQPVEKKAVNQENTQPKTRGKRDTSNPTNVNMEKLIERLGTSVEIGPEYVSFVCQFAEQAKQKETKLNESVSKLQRELKSKNDEIDQLHEQLYTAQLTFGKVQSLEQALKDENAKYNLFVASVTPKLGENQQLRETNHRLEAQLNNQKINFANSMEKLKRESEQFVLQLRNSLTQANNQIHQKDVQIKQLEEELSQKSDKGTEIEDNSGLVEELRETILEKERYIEQIQEEFAQKAKAADRLIDELKQKEQQIIMEKDKQIGIANDKLEAELKESLLRIDELRSKNYKLVESINTLYKYNQTNENKKPVEQEVSG